MKLVRGVIIKKQRKQSDHIFKIGENCLEYSPFYKYLGVLFDERTTAKILQNRVDGH